MCTLPSTGEDFGHLWVQLIGVKTNEVQLEGWPKESKVHLMRKCYLEIWIVCPNMSRRSQSKEEDIFSQLGKECCKGFLPFHGYIWFHGIWKRKQIHCILTRNFPLNHPQNLSLANLSFSHKSVIMALLNGIVKDQGFGVFLMFTNQGSSMATLSSPGLLQT